MHKTGNNGQPWVTFQDASVPSVTSPDQAYFHARSAPILTGGNIYSPCFLPRVGGGWHCWFGGQLSLSLPNDQVYYSWTADPTLQTSWVAPQTVIPLAPHYYHINDPSVAHRDGQYIMAMTTAVPDATLAHGFRDTISIIISPDGVTWPTLDSTAYEVQFSNATFTAFARPSLLWNEVLECWELFFDGFQGPPQQPYRLHLARSTEAIPHTFTYVGECGDFYAGEVARVAGKYIVAYAHYNDYLTRPLPIRFATSVDGLAWTPIPSDPPSGYVRYDTPLCPWGGHDPNFGGGYTNPGWAHDGQTVTALGVSTATQPGVGDHKISVAYPQQRARPDGIHVDSMALTPSAFRVDLHGFSSFMNVLVRSSPLVQPVTEQQFGVLGDVFSFAEQPPPPPGALEELIEACVDVEADVSVQNSVRVLAEKLRVYVGG